MAQSFLEVARELIDSPAAKTDYAEDPEGFLAARGLEGFASADLEVAVSFVAEAVPAPVARQLALDAPGTAPDPAALARLAAVTEVEAEVRAAEPGTVELAAVIDPGGELGIPDSVDLTTLTPTPAGDEGEEEVGAEASNGEQADASGVELPETAETDVADPDLVDAADPDDEAENGGEDDSQVDDGFELDPELQPTVDPEGTSDAGLPASGAATAGGEVEVPPEETFEDLV